MPSKPMTLRSSPSTATRVNRDTVSDREWLGLLADRLESVFELMD